MTYKNWRVNVPLTNYSEKYTPYDFVCDQALTEVTSDKQTGILASYGTEHIRLIQSRVKDRGEYLTTATASRSLSNTYYIGKHGVKAFITEDDYENASEPFDARMDTVEELETLLKLEKENALQTLLRTDGNYSSNHVVTLSGDALWDAFGTSDPTKDISDAMELINSASHVRANAMIIPRTVLYKLMFHPKLISAAGSGYLNSISLEQIKKLFMMDYIYVPNVGHLNSSGNEADLWGKDVIVYHKAPAQSKRIRTFGVHLNMKGRKQRVFVKDAPGLVNSDTVFIDKTYSFLIRHKDAGVKLKGVIG